MITFKDLFDTEDWVPMVCIKQPDPNWEEIADSYLKYIPMRIYECKIRKHHDRRRIYPYTVKGFGLPANTWQLFSLKELKICFRIL